MAAAETTFEQSPTIQTDLTDRILTATLNRPERLNASNEQMIRDMLSLYEAAAATIVWAP